MNLIFPNVIILVLALNIVLFFLVIRELKLYYDKRKDKAFKKSIEKIKVKERVQLINLISSELHDNISQMISLAKMNVKSLDSNTVNQKTKENIISLLGKSLSDIRYLNKMIKLQETRDIDVNRQIEELIEVLNQSSTIDFKKNGQILQLGQEKNFLLFRIMQELLNNLMKYSKASDVEIKVDKEIISIFHNGISFIPLKEDYNKSFGLTNINENKMLLNAEIEYSTNNPKIKIKLPLTYKD
ncbi:MAG: sensor histidine kinase [Bacteroidales bacterium]